MSDLMTYFPPISHEDPLEVLAQYISQNFLETTKVIAWEHISEKVDEPLRAIRRKRKIESDEAKDESQKQPKKVKAVKPAASGIQKEVAELEPSQILTKRTRGGGSDRTSLAQTAVKQPMHKTR